MRRRLVDDQARITNRLTSALKNYFPQALEWFADKASLLLCDFPARWPTVKAARQARRVTLERFFHEHNVRRPVLIQKRIEHIVSDAAQKRLTSDLIACPRWRSQEANSAVVRYSPN